MAFYRKQIFKTLIAWLFVCILSCSILGCGAGPVWQREDPDVVLTGFLQAVEAQNTEVIWEFLDQKTRDVLQARADDFNASPENGHARKAWDMIRPGHVLATTREYKKMTPEKVSETTAIVAIILHDDSKITVTMQRESNRWTVALPL